MTSIDPRRYADLTDATSEAGSYAEQAENLLTDLLGQQDTALSMDTRVMVGVGFALLSIGKRLQAVEEVLGQDLDLRTHPAEPVSISVPTVRPTPIREVRS
jgi:hypothetical protein